MDLNLHLIYDLFYKLDIFFSFTLNILLKSFHSFVNDLDKTTLQNLPDVSLDTNMNFEIFDTIGAQNPFANIGREFESFKDKQFNNVLQSHKEQDSHNQLLSLLQNLPSFQKNLVSAYLEANINYKKCATIKVSNHIKLFSSTFNKFNELTSNFLNCYYSSLENEKKYIKNILKTKIKDYLKNDYINFLKLIKDYLNNIKNLENFQKINNKEFSHELEPCLIESKLYLNELKLKYFSQRPVSPRFESEESEQTGLQQHMQIHQLNKWKQELVSNSSKNFTKSLMILKEMEQDILENEKNNIKKVIINENLQNNIDLEEQILILLKQNETLTFNLLQHKEAIKEIIKQTYKEFIKRLYSEKKETIKIVLKDFIPYLQQKEEDLKKNKIETITKLQFQESLLNEIIKEIEEQKKQYKDISMKLDLSVKILKEETSFALQKFQSDSFSSFYKSTQQFIQLISDQKEN